jgi:hypothetical protein
MGSPDDAETYGIKHSNRQGNKRLRAEIVAHKTVHLMSHFEGIVLITLGNKTCYTAAELGHVNHNEDKVKEHQGTG